MNDKTRVIHVITKYFYPVVGGIELNIAQTYSRLAKRGWRVVVHTSNNTRTQKNALPKIGIHKGIQIYRYPYAWWGYIPKINWGFRGIVALHNFNVFPHLHLFCLIAVRKILMSKDFSVILVPHGGFTPGWEIFNSVQSFIKRLYHNTIGLLCINAIADGIRAISDWERRELIKVGVRPELVKTIENGLEEETFSVSNKRVNKAVKELVENLGSYVVQIGRMNKQKNFETTLKALASLPVHVKFVVMGPNQTSKYREKINKLINSLGIKNRVVFIGTLHGMDKYYVLRHSEMMVHMAIWESFCNGVYEGMSQGLVCVVADNTALRDAINSGNTGFRVGTYDHKSLSRIMRYLLENSSSKEIKKIRLAAKQYARKNTWQQTAEKMEHFYSQILGSRN